MVLWLWNLPRTIHTISRSVSSISNWLYCPSHKSDTTAWCPKYYAPEFIKFANTTGKNTVMFGTNFPQVGFEACVNDFNSYLVEVEGGHKDSVARGDALQVLKLPQPAPNQSQSKL